jgi:hypothetical protein
VSFVRCTTTPSTTSGLHQAHLPTTATDTGPAGHRESRVRRHVEGRHSSPLREFLVIGLAYRAQEGQRLASMRCL